jgi:hypothetical protein
VNGPIGTADKNVSDQIVAGKAVSDPSNLFVIQIPDGDRQCFGQVDGILIRFCMQLTVQIIGLPVVYQRKQHPLHE